MKVNKAAEIIVYKWLKKGNMARAMRDVLPSSGLSDKDREKIAEMVHDIVRFKKLYDYALAGEGKEKTPKNYVWLAHRRELLDKYKKLAFRENLHEVYLSASPTIAKIIMQYPKFGEMINREPRTHLSVNINKIEISKAIEVLKEEGVNPKKCQPETCVAVDSRGRYSTLVNDGLAIVQDSSSQELSKLVSSLGTKILDFCAGSGGKSFTVKFFNPMAEVHVHDANEKKLNSLFLRAEKLGLEMRKFNFSGEYDVVLVDAPCSGLGSAARNPEAKYQEDLGEYPKTQMQILEEAKGFVKDGGFLIYSVCTFNPEETYGVVEKFMSEHDFEEFQIASKHLKKEKIGSFITSGDIIYFAVLRKI